MYSPAIKLLSSKKKENNLLPIPRLAKEGKRRTGPSDWCCGGVWAGGCLRGSLWDTQPCLAAEHPQLPRQDPGCCCWWEGAGQKSWKAGVEQSPLYLFGISEKEINKWPTTTSELSLIRREDNLRERTCICQLI